MGGWTTLRDVVERSIPLPGIPGSEEFMAAYSMALAMIPDSAGSARAVRRRARSTHSLSTTTVPKSGKTPLLTPAKSAGASSSVSVPSTATSASRCCAKSTSRKCSQQLPNHR